MPASRRSGRVRLQILGFAAGILVGAGCHGNFAGSVRGHVARVTDGDTIEVRLEDGVEENVRVIGIDAPEARDNAKLQRQTADDPESRPAILAMGREATEHAQLLLPDGTPVEIVFDPANDGSSHRDRYGRLLGYVYVLDEDGRRSTFFNERMVADGYAAALTSFPFRQDMKRRLQAAAREARREERGLWAADPAPFEH